MTIVAIVVLSTALIVAVTYALLYRSEARGYRQGWEDTLDAWEAWIERIGREP